LALEQRRAGKRPGRPQDVGRGEPRGLGQAAAQGRLEHVSSPFNSLCLPRTPTPPAPRAAGPGRRCRVRASAGCRTRRSSRRPDASSRDARRRAEQRQARSAGASAARASQSCTLAWSACARSSTSAIMRQTRTDGWCRWLSRGDARASPHRLASSDACARARWLSMSPGFCPARRRTMPTLFSGSASPDGLR